nr:FHA domain-containing protein [Bifidobacterium saguinibicoloris]
MPEESEPDGTVLSHFGGTPSAVAENHAVPTAVPNAPAIPAPENGSTPQPAPQPAPVSPQAQEETSPKPTIPTTPVTPSPRPTQPSVQTGPSPDDRADDGETRIFGSAARTGFTVTRLRDGRTLNATGAIARKATIGRSKTADLHMGGNTNVSRIHATIEMLPDGRFSITDNHSANGTSVRGREIAAGGTEFLTSGEDFELADDTFIITLI